jgi:hypothetical protein
VGDVEAIDERLNVKTAVSFYFLMSLASEVVCYSMLMVKFLAVQVNPLNAQQTILTAIVSGFGLNPV